MRRIDRPRLVASKDEDGLTLWIESVDDPQWTARALNPQLAKCEPASPERGGVRKPQRQSFGLEEADSANDRSGIGTAEPKKPLLELGGAENFDHKYASKGLVRQGNEERGDIGRSRRS